MRVQPRPLITLGLVVAYMAIVGIVWAVVGLDYDAVGDSTSTIIKGIVLPVVLGAVFLAIATSYLGWWGPAIHETLGAPRWLWVVPALMVLPGIGYTLGGAPSSDRSLSYLLALAVGTLFVGFSEEMLCRGTGLVGLRGGFREPLAWALSCLIFGLIHALNAFFGQSLGSTIQQIGIAFLAGSVLYITRRVAGTLIVCMVLHAWIDFTTFAFSKASADAGSIFSILGFGQYAAFLLALIGVFIVLRNGPKTTTEPAGAHAAA
jgi:hypothetical protein